MNFTTKNFIQFLLAFIGLSACFSLLFQKIYVGIPIGLFLAICMFYDPKKYEASKKKFDENKSANDDCNN